MTKSLSVGLACFSFSYIALSLLGAWLLPDQGWLSSIWISYLPVNGLVALCAVLIGFSAGRLSVTGTALCALVIYILVFVITIGLLVAISSRGKGTLVWPPLLGAALAREWVGWVVGFVAGVGWPVLWLLVCRRLSPRPAQLVSS
jgi:hypothetical protein